MSRMKSGNVLIYLNYKRSTDVVSSTVCYNQQETTIQHLSIQACLVTHQLFNHAVSEIMKNQFRFMLFFVAQDGN